MSSKSATQGLFLMLTLVVVSCLVLAGSVGCVPQSEGGNENSNINDNGGGGIDGSVLYTVNCAACHGADAMGTETAPNIERVSASEITEAIDQVQVMANITLTADEINAIAAFLSQ